MRLILVLAAFWAAVSACAGRPTADPVGSGHAAAATTAAPGTATVTAARPSTHTPTPSPAASATHTPTPSATVRPSATSCAERRGRVNTLAVPSATLRYDIDARVYLPPCYTANQKRYPVLYLIHGLSYTEDQWERLGVATTADALIADGEIAPLIIVMPRDRKDTRFDPAFVDDLIPYVDEHYRTLDSRPYRAIGGLSRGAGWAIHLGLHYPDVFSRVGAHSPAVFFGDENNVLAYARAIDRTGQVPALYVDVGEGDANRQSAFWLDQVFTWFDFGHTYRLQPGAHTESYWSAHVDDYLRFYAADWLTPPVPTPTATVVE
jgi:enterochelin esterase-like enzyme